MIRYANVGQAICDIADFYISQTFLVCKKIGQQSVGFGTEVTVALGNSMY